MNLRICLLFLLQCSTSCRSTTSKYTLHGKVVCIADGDTFTMPLGNKTTIQVRLAGLDFPELNRLALQ